MTYEHRTQYYKFNAVGSGIYLNFIFLRPTYVRQQKNSTYGLTLHRKILLFNLNSIIIRQTSLNCFPDSTGQMYEQCLLLSTPSPTQPEQDITSVAPTMNNYQNSFQDVTFYFSLMSQIVKLWSLRWVGINHVVTFLGNKCYNSQAEKWLFPFTSITIRFNYHQGQISNRWASACKVMGTDRFAWGFWFPVHYWSFIFSRDHIWASSLYVQLVM